MSVMPWNPQLPPAPFMQPQPAPTAVVADDERLMRDQIVARLKEAWPELVIVGEASNGTEAIALVQSEEPDIVFLDIRMQRLTSPATAFAVSTFASTGVAAFVPSTTARGSPCRV